MVTLITNKTTNTYTGLLWKWLFSQDYTLYDNYNLEYIYNNWQKKQKSKIEEVQNNSLSHYFTVGSEELKYWE